MGLRACPRPVKFPATPAWLLDYTREVPTVGLYPDTHIHAFGTEYLMQGQAGDALRFNNQLVASLCLTAMLNVPKMTGVFIHSTIEQGDFTNMQRLDSVPILDHFGIYK